MLVKVRPKSLELSAFCIEMDSALQLQQVKAWIASAMTFSCILGESLSQQIFAQL